MEYLSHSCLAGLCARTFQQQTPYPWVNVPGTLTEQGYEQLRATLPDISLFEKHVSMKRAFGQGYQDRFLLHYRPGVPVAAPWQEFIEELRGPAYHAFIRRMFDLPRGKSIIFTMEWYFAWQGCAVPPHCDARRKLGTHIFYFNTEDDWAEDWGGRILLLDDGGKWHPHTGPGFDDLKTSVSLDPRGNGSLLFQRTEHSWHGVRPLACPPDALRKLFIVTINIPTFQVIWRRLRGKDPDGYPLRKAA
jgi:hypothetical protein